jgi:hypothetical protein
VDAAPPSGVESISAAAAAQSLSGPTPPPPASLTSELRDIEMAPAEVASTRPPPPRGSAAAGYGDAKPQTEAVTNAVRSRPRLDARCHKSPHGYSTCPYLPVPFHLIPSHPIPSRPVPSRPVPPHPCTFLKWPVHLTRALPHLASARA